jgi:outer membrane protein OmpA-like peptidoglycan-associated protein
MIDPVRAAAGIAIAAWLAVMLTACASRSTVVLLPSDDGRPTAVTVTKGGSEVVLDRPYAAVTDTPFGLAAYPSNAGDVASRYRAALDARPGRPARFVLYFIEGTDELTEESGRSVGAVLSEVTSRPVPDVVVVGHADRLGNDAFNDALSLRRAESIRAELLRRGLAAENVQAIGRGRREPAVATAEGVAEPRNRRVVIIVR